MSFKLLRNREVRNLSEGNVSAKAQAQATARATVLTDEITLEKAKPQDRNLPMQRVTHTPGGLQDALRSSSKGSWKFALFPLGFAALILLLTLAFGLFVR